MNLEEMIQLQVLKFKASHSARGALNDALIDQAEADGKVKPVQMCAKVSPQLYEAVDHVCQMLDLTKREFIEAAVVEAVAIAERHIDKMGEDLQQRIGGV
jgi:hypothetical protein